MAYSKYDNDWTTGESVPAAAMDHIEQGIEDAHDLIPTTEAIQDLVAALFTSGTHTNITFDYDDTGAAINATAEAGGGGDYSAEIAAIEARLDALEAAAADTALKSDGLTQFADVSDTPAAVDGQALVFSETSSTYEPVALADNYAPVDPSTGRLLESAYPKYMLEGIVQDSGETAPVDLPAYALRYERSTPAPTLGITEVGKNANGSSSVNNVVVTLTDGLAVDDELIVCIGTSGEATAPTSFSVTLSSGAVTGATQVYHLQGATALTTIYRATVSTAISSGATVTVTARDGVAGAGSAVSRSDFAVKVAKATGLAASSRADQTGGNGGSSASFNVASTGATAVADELAVACFCANPTGLTFTPGTNWNSLGTAPASTDASPRALWVVYRVLTATGTVTATASVAGGSVVYSASLQTFRVA